MVKFKPKNVRRAIVILVVAGLIIGSSLLALHLINRDASSNITTSQSGTVSDFGKGEDTTITEKPTNETTTPNDKDTTPQKSKTLVEPTGTFVSNHSPNLSGSPSPNKIQSVCSTTPHATCFIRFTKGDVVVETPKQEVDSGGGAYWTWTLADLNITEGGWSVEAVATLDGQTKTAKDSMTMEVKP